jgi:hypothetical protein
MVNVTLPHFYEITEAFENSFKHKLKEAVRKKGIASQIRTHVIHEGSHSSIERLGEGPEEIERRSISAEATIDKTKIEVLTQQDVERLIDEMAEPAAKQQSALIFDGLDKATKNTGNVVDGAGQPLTHELLFETIEKIQQDFDGDPDNSNLIMVVNPSMMERIKTLEEEFKKSPALQKKHNDLKVKKYEQYRDREMDRTLVG